MKKNYTNYKKITSLILSVIICASCAGQTNNNAAVEALAEQTRISGTSTSETTAAATTETTTAETTTEAATAETSTEAITAETTTEAATAETTTEAATAGTTAETATAETTTETTTAETTTEAATAGTTAETTTAVQTSVSYQTAAVSEVTAPDRKKVYEAISDCYLINGQALVKLSDGHWWAMPLYTLSSGKKYAAVLNHIRKKVDSGVRMYSMPIPTSSEYYLPDLFSDHNGSQTQGINNINSQLDDGIIVVPACDAMWEHISEDIYLRTDHHWQPLGAYYAAKTFAQYAGVPFSDISTMTRVDKNGFVGSELSYVKKDERLASDSETFTFYKPTNKYTTYYYDTAYNFQLNFSFFIDQPVSASYSTFMGADNKIVRITTDVGNGRKLMIFKDSYGNAEASFYFGSFEEIYVCDMRYFDLDPFEFIKQKGITDLLISTCLFSTSSQNIDTFAGIVGYKG